MNYKLIRKLKGVPLPVGMVTTEEMEQSGVVTCLFRKPLSRKNCYTDFLEWRVPRWLCSSMPYYFRAVKGEAK